ncbi:phosphoribosyl-ATP diphosphatase [Myxococcota bacterium]|nr:phosphoribosyl-ATP diphosphatase [Myxococcota bacterium]
MLVPGLTIRDGWIEGAPPLPPDADARAGVLRRAMELSRAGEIEVRNPCAAGEDHDPLVRRLARTVPCRVVTAVPDEDKARRLLRSGARKLVLPSRFPRDMLSRLPRGRTLVALRTLDGRQCYADETGDRMRPALEWMQVLAPYCSGFRISFEDPEGRPLPPDPEALGGLTRALNMEFTVAARIRSVEEVRALDRLGCDVVADDALAEGRFSPAEAVAACLDFPANGMPVVLVDRSGQVIRLVTLGRETLKAAMESGRMDFFVPDHPPCRECPDACAGGVTLVRVLPDCRRSAAVLVVEGAVPGCRKGRYSCFGSGAREFGLQRLYEIIAARRADPRPGSYSSFLFEKEDRIPRKLTEEMFELLTARGREDLTWEAADVLFFLLAYLVRHEVTLEEVIAELGGRER